MIDHIVLVWLLLREPRFGPRASRHHTGSSGSAACPKALPANVGRVNLRNPSQVCYVMPASPQPPSSTPSLKSLSTPWPYQMRPCLLVSKFQPYLHTLPEPCTLFPCPPSQKVKRWPDCVSFLFFPPPIKSLARIFISLPFNDASSLRTIPTLCHDGRHPPRLHCISARPRRPDALSPAQATINALKPAPPSSYPKHLQLCPSCDLHRDRDGKYRKPSKHFCHMH